MIVAAVALSMSEPGFLIEPLHILGIGRWDCATAFRPERREEAAVWIVGFWTGMNATRVAGNGRRTQVGSGLDASGVVAEVEHECQKKATVSLAVATETTFERLAKGLQGR